MLRGVIVSIIIVLNIVLQSTLMQYISIRGISLNLFVITVVSFAMMRGKIEGAIIGFMIGLCQDIFFGSVLGLYAWLYMFIGFLAGYFNKTFYRDSTLIPLSIVAASDLSLNLFLYIFTFLFRGRTEFDYFLINTIIPELTFTVLASIFIYKLYLTINKKLEYYDNVKRGKHKV